MGDIAEFSVVDYKIANLAGAINTKLQWIFDDCGVLQISTNVFMDCLICTGSSGQALISFTNSGCSPVIFNKSLWLLFVSALLGKVLGGSPPESRVRFSVFFSTLHPSRVVTPLRPLLPGRCTSCQVSLSNALSISKWTFNIFFNLSFYHPCNMKDKLSICREKV
jgi:hypothetical protein